MSSPPCYPWLPSKLGHLPSPWRTHRSQEKEGGRQQPEDGKRCKGLVLSSWIISWITIFQGPQTMLLCPGDNQSENSEKVNWDIKVFPEGSKKPVFGREWRAIEKLKLPINVSHCSSFIILKILYNITVFSWKWLLLKLFEDTVWGKTWISNWKEGETSTSQRPGPLPHPYSSLYPENGASPLGEEKCQQQLRI